MDYDDDQIPPSAVYQIDHSIKRLKKNATAISKGKLKEGTFKKGIRGGVKNVFFKFDCEDLGKEDYLWKGSVLRCGKNFNRARFWCLLRTPRNNRIAVDSLSNLECLRTPYLLLPLEVSLDIYQEFIVVIHEDFDSYFNEWLKLENNRAYLADPFITNRFGDNELKDFWVISIRNILDTLDYLHKTGRAHGHLNQDGSYVMRGNKIHIIQPSLHSAMKEATVANKMEDLIHLRQFLTSCIGLIKQQMRVPNDWDSFFNFKTSEVSDLRKHPLVLFDKERFDYYVEIGHHMGYHQREYLFNINQLINKELINPCKDGKDWTDVICDEHSASRKPCIAYNVLMHSQANSGTGVKVKAYSPTMSELVRFIDNATHHGGEHAQKFKGLIYFEIHAAMEMGHLFPGFLSALHQLLTRKFKFNRSVIVREVNQAKQRKK